MWFRLATGLLTPRPRKGGTPHSRSRAAQVIKGLCSTSFLWPTHRTWSHDPHASAMIRWLLLQAGLTRATMALDFYRAQCEAWYLAPAKEAHWGWL